MGWGVRDVKGVCLCAFEGLSLSVVTVPGSHFRDRTKLYTEICTVVSAGKDDWLATHQSGNDLRVNPPRPQLNVGRLS